MRCNSPGGSCMRCVNSSQVCCWNSRWMGNCCMPRYPRGCPSTAPPAHGRAGTCRHSCLMRLCRCAVLPWPRPRLQAVQLGGVCRSTTMGKWVGGCWMWSSARHRGSRHPAFGCLPGRLCRCHQSGNAWLFWMPLPVCPTADCCKTGWCRPCTTAHVTTSWVGCCLSI